MIKKRILALLLAVSLVMPSVLPASAAEPQSNGKTVEAEAGTDTSEAEESGSKESDTSETDKSENRDEALEKDDTSQNTETVPTPERQPEKVDDGSDVKEPESEGKPQKDSYKVILDVPEFGTLSFPMEEKEILADEKDPWTPMQEALKQQEEMEQKGVKTEKDVAPNEEVTVYVSSDYGYQMTSIQAVSEKTKEVVSVLETDEEGKVTFKMPEEDIRIQVEYQELDPEKEIEEKEAYEAQEAQAAERSAPATMKRAAAEPRKSIYLYVPSSKLWYGSYNTRYYTTNEGKYAYCIEPRRKAPKAGYYSASVMYNTNVRKAAYYAYGGPGYSKYRASYGNIWDGSQKNEYIYSHIIISYIYAKYYLGSNSEANFAFYGLSSRAKSKLITKANNLLKLSAPPSGYTCYTMATSYKNGNKRSQAMLCQTYNSGSLNLKKVSSNTAMTNGNDMYSLNGAQYGVYSNSGCTSKVGTLTTNANGVSNTLTLNPGTYYIKETKAPLGYELSKTVTTAVVPDSGTKTVTVSDKPIDDPAAIVIKKLDRITGKEIQGGASLAGAQFTVKYYNGLYTKNNLPQNATRTWVIETKMADLGDGQNTAVAILDDGYKVAGDPFYKVGNFVTIPRGTVTIQETKAPEGYENNLSLTDQNGQGGDDLYLVQIQKEGDMSSISGGNVFEGTDTVMRGDFSFTKKNGATNKIMANIPFKITNVASGEAHTVYTDENGYFSSQSSYVKHSQNTNREQAKSGLWFGDLSVLDDNEGALPFGDYTIEELSCSANAGLKMYKGKFQIDQNGMVWEFGTIVNSQIEIATQVLDTTTGSSTIGSMNDEYGYVIGDEINIDGLSTGYAELKLKDKATGEYIKDAKGNDLKAGGEITEGYGHDGMANLGLEVPTEVLHTLQGKTIVACVRVYALNSNGTPNYSKLLGAHEDLDDLNETLYFPSLETTMTEKTTGLHDSSVSGASVFEDTVKVQNIPARFYELESSFIYKFVGTLVDQNGTPVKGADGKNITASTAVKQMSDRCFDDTFTLTYNVPESVKQKYAGQTLHSFVELWGSVYSDQDFLSLIAFERDVKNPSQTISLPIIESTRVSKDILTSSDTGIVDEVVLKGLTKENWYTVEGQIVDKETGNMITQTRKVTYGKDDFDYQYAIPGEGANYSVTQSATYGTIFQTENGYFRLNEDEVYIFCEADGTQLGVKTLTRDEFESELFPGDTFEEKRPLSVQYTFVANKKDDTKQVKFTFDVDALRGKSYVVTEKLYHGKGKNAVILERTKSELLPGPLFNKAVKDDCAANGTLNSIIFTDKPLPDGVNATDLSVSQNGAVWGYFDANSNYIITSDQNGDIEFNNDSSKMFHTCTAKHIVFEHIDTSNVTNMSAMFQGCYELLDLDVSKFNTSNVTDMSYMFSYEYRCPLKLTDLDLSNFDTSKVKNMAGMFIMLETLTNLDVSSFDTSNVTTMDSMFSACTDLTTLNVSHFDTSKVTNMGYMFSECSSLTNLNVSSFDTSQVASMNFMFNGCRSLEKLNISSFNTSNVETMERMFSYCSNLTTLDVTGFNTSNVTNMSYTFANCSSLELINVDHFDTSNVKKMDRLFTGCSGLKNIDVSNFDTNKVTDMAGMFSRCSNLSTLDLSSFDTSNVDSMYDMFQDCTSLTDINVSSIETKNVDSMSDMFANCTSLTQLDLSSFDFTNLIDTRSMFEGCGNLVTIYVSQEMVVNSSFVQSNMFLGCTSIIGGTGVKYDASKTDETMANWKTGYLTLKNGPILRKDCMNEINNWITEDKYNTIVFDDSTVPVSGNTLDLSMKNNRSVLAYLDESTKTLHISSNNKGDIIFPEDSSYMFADIQRKKSIFKNVYTGKVTNMQGMFKRYNHSGTTTPENAILDLSKFDFSNVTDVSSMFEEACVKLKNLNLNTCNTKNFSKMFYTDPNAALYPQMSGGLAGENHIKIDITNAENLYQMFHGNVHLFGSISFRGNPKLSSDKYDSIFAWTSAMAGNKRLTIYGDGNNSVLLNAFVSTKYPQANIVFDPSSSEEVNSLATTFALSSVGTKIANTVENVKAAEDGAKKKNVDKETQETMSPKTAEEKKENPVVSFFSSLFSADAESKETKEADLNRLDLMDTHNDLNDENQTFYVADIQTELTNVDGEHFYTPNGTASLTDKVTYSGLKPNQEYTLTGQLINKDTGAVVVEKTVTFTPSATKGTINVPFSFDASGLGGVTLVAYETLSGTVSSYGTPVGTYVLAEHKDKNDENQTVTSMSISTSAADKKTNTKMVMPASDAAVVDTVSYKGAVTGQTYRLEATLMQKYKEEAAVDSTGKTVTGSAEFTPTTKNGSQAVELSFDATSMPSGEYVVFEKLYAVNGDKKELWTTHEDYNDAAQTITITGFDTNIYDAGTLTNMAYPKKNMEVHDIVTYTGFQTGKTYTLDWKLVDVATGKDYVDAAGKTVKKTQNFTPDATDGEFEIVDTFDGSKLNGQNLTAVTTVKLGSSVLFEHNKNLDNEYETISIPGLDTVATETGTGAKEVYAIPNISITDKITYQKLQVGLEHIVKTSIVDKKTGEVLQNSKKEPLTFESEIAPDEADGVYEAVLEFNGKGLAGVEAVVFQEIWLGDTLIAQHKDLNDTDQTFTFKEMPKRTAEVVKRIKASDFHKEHGNITFLFKMTGEDVCGETHTYYREITFTEEYVKANTVNGYVEKSASFEQVPMGTYTVTEEDSARYKLAKVEKIKNAVVEGKAAKYDLITNETASSKFTNIKYEWQGYSDTSIVINNILKKPSEEKKPLLKDRNVIIIGERDGIPGPAIMECVESAGGNVVSFDTEFFGTAAVLSNDMQNKIIKLTKQYKKENLIVILGVNDPEIAYQIGETLTTGDPLYVGPLTGVALGLDVYHICEPEIKELIDDTVYEEQVAMMEPTVDIEEISAKLQEIRSTK